MTSAISSMPRHAPVAAAPGGCRVSRPAAGSQREERGPARARDKSEWPPVRLELQAVQKILKKARCPAGAVGRAFGRPS